MSEDCRILRSTSVVCASMFVCLWCDEWSCTGSLWMKCNGVYLDVPPGLQIHIQVAYMQHYVPTGSSLGLHWVFTGSSLGLQWDFSDW